MNRSLYDQSVWRLIEPYFDQALDLQPDDRERWFAEITTSNPDIAQSVRQLLVERDALEARGFLQSSAVAESALDEFVHTLQTLDGSRGKRDNSRNEFSSGLEIAGYRLIREVGYGGMSTVWLAERSDGQLKRTVALKLPFVQSRRHKLAERFERERDILATLTHPNIARLYDAGVDSSGQPFLAMEYVEGEPLTKYCDTARLTIRERLKLFVQVFDAVQYAHSQLVLHRDLKPSNILVTSLGRVVLLDFGIAKIISSDETAEMPATEFSNRALTPDYASPEQISRQPLGTGSDIYSLGVVLCELLTGTRPYRLKRNSVAELENAILSSDPPRMSQHTFDEEFALKRDTTAGKLAKTLKGDLDTIALKALKKIPRDRYLSITDFSEDIQNYLDSLPVKARPDSPWYRLGRFVVRHPLPVSAASVTLLAIIGGSIVAIHQERVATAERDRANTFASRDRAINEFTELLITEAAASKNPVTVTEMLARSEKLALADTSGNKENQAAILGMIAERYQTLGNIGKSASLFERALGLASDSRDAALRSRLTCERAAVIAHLGQVADAIRTITGELDNQKLDSWTAANCLHYRSLIAKLSGDAEGVIQYASQGVERLQMSAEKTETDEGLYLSDIASGYRMKGSNGKANQYFELAIQKYVFAGRERSDNALSIRNNWALVSTNLGVPKRALEQYKQIFRSRVESGEKELPATEVINYARALELVGRYEEARQEYELARQHGDPSRNLLDRAYSLLGLASVAVQSNEITLASQHLKNVGDLPGLNLFPVESPIWARMETVQGNLALAEGKVNDAREQFERVLRKKSSGSNTVLAKIGKAEVELLSGDANHAIDDARAALDIAESLQEGVQHSNWTGLSFLMLGRAFEKSGDKAQAHHAFEQAVQHLSNTVDDDHPALVQARELLAKN